jgi:glycosyltransferase involved in cell wall biosynthesis
MKIIHVLSGLTKGGGERIVVELANKAAENGDEVTIIAGWPVDPAYLQNSIDSKVSVKFVSETKGRAYSKIISFLLKNKKWICSQDVLHCHLTYGAVFGSMAKIILRSFFRKNRPVIVETNHAVGMPVPKFNRWVHSRMMLMRDGLALMAKDQYWNNFIRSHPRLKTQIIPNGISMLKPQNDPDLKKRFNEQMGITGNCKYIVGTISMLRPDRKPWLYIPIFAGIYKVLGDEVQFIIAGGGSELDKIKGLVEDHGLSGRVHMPGIINAPAAVLSNMDMYVSVSVGETAGISMIEAAMCNVPVVAIQLIETYITKNEDWVWSHTDTKEVAKKIISLLQNGEERSKLAEKQNKYVKDHFTSGAMYLSYDAFYKQILLPG